MYFPLPPPIRPWRKFTSWYLLRSKGISSLFHQTLQDLPLTYPTLPPSEASYFWLHISCGTDFFLFISPANSDFYLNFYRVMVIWTDIPVKLATSVSPVCLFGRDGNNLVFISSATIYLTREISATSRLNWLHLDPWKQSFLTKMCFFLVQLVWEVNMVIINIYIFLFLGKYLITNNHSAFGVHCNVIESHQISIYLHYEQNVLSRILITYYFVYNCFLNPRQVKDRGMLCSMSLLKRLLSLT